MPIRFAAGAGLSALLMLIALAAGQTGRPTILKDGFSGRDVSFQKGDANIPFNEADHKISAEHHKSAATSEYIKVEANPPGGAAEAEFIHYFYPTPQAPLVERMTARTYVKAYRPGVQVKARIVLPRERDPKSPESPLAILIPGETYTKVRQWQSLAVDDPVETLKKQLPALRARLGREVDISGAYLDRLVLNVYAGPGVTEVWIDDLEVGPVRAAPEKDRPAVGKDAAALPAGRAKGKAVSVEFSEGQILVDGEPFFFLGIRHSDTPLKTLRDAQFNTVFFPNDVPAETIEEAVRHGFWTVPTLPLPAGGWDGSAPRKPDPKELERDADAVANYLRKFLSGDAVLMWDLGSGRTTEDLPRVIRAAEVVRRYDPRRPRSVDLWDGFQDYGRYVNAIGAHRWPLFSSLDLDSYRDWLVQRKALTPPFRLFWTWIQTHLPEWYVEQMYGQKQLDRYPVPIGPHPEQIRILTYLALSAGCRGLGFWDDKFLAKDTHFGKDRMLELAILNAEIDMLKPVLAGSQDAINYVPTSDPNVKAAIISASKEVLILPVWVGPGTQFVPPQGTVSQIRLVIPVVPEGASPWRITPAGVEQLKQFKRIAGGTELLIPEFDLTAAIVFTTDLGPTGKVARWQDHTRFRMGKTAAEWAQMEAVEQYEKTAATHARILAAGGPEIPEAAELFAGCRENLRCAKEAYENKQWDLAFRESRRALRPMRVLMRADWDKAVGSLDTPTASPYAVSFYSLPEHWALAAEVGVSRAAAGSALAHGGFELSRPAPATGAAVDSLPGYKVRTSILDDVTGVAAIINADSPGVQDPPPVPPNLGTSRKSAIRVAPQPLVQRHPECGTHTLRLQITQNATTPGILGALERAVLAVDTPSAELAPGGLVRISFWLKVTPLLATADGLVAFDSAGGEALGVRTRYQPTWKQYHLYRRVPPSGKISLTFALTGIGTAYVDDVRVEPLIPGAPALPSTSSFVTPPPPEQDGALLKKPREKK